MKRYKVTNKMNTKQLGLILVAGLFLSSTASALNLNPVKAKPDAEPPVVAVPAGTVVIADEIRASDLDTVEGEDYNVTGETGFIIPSESAGYFARFQLEGATFASPLTNASVPNQCDTGLGDQFQIAAGGGIGDDYTVVAVGNTTGILPQGREWTLEGATYDISSKKNVKFTYTLHQDAGDAVNQEDPLNTQSGLLIEFKNATSMSGKAASNTKLIDVASSGVLFELGGKTSTIMEISLKTTEFAAIDPDNQNEEPTFDIVAENVDLTVTGNFGSINLGDEDADPVVPAAGKVWLDKSPECTINTPAVPETNPRRW